MVAPRRTNSATGDASRMVSPVRECDHRHPKPGWYVECDDYVSGPHKDLAAAERKLVYIMDGAACALPHRIVEYR